TEIACLRIKADDVAQISAHDTCGIAVFCAGTLDTQGEGFPVGQGEVAPEQAAIGIRGCAHAFDSLWHQCLQLGLQRAVGIEELLWLIAAHPFLEHFPVRRVATRIRYWDLVGAPEILDLLAVPLPRPGPALGAAQHDHRPARTLHPRPFGSRVPLDCRYPVEGLVERVSHASMH